MILQAAVYGIGVCAEFGGSVFRPLVGGIIVNCFGRLLSLTVLTCPLTKTYHYYFYLFYRSPFEVE